MIDYIACLKEAFPNVLDSQYKFEDHGEGPQLVYWDSAVGPRPTIEQLATYNIFVLRKIKKEQMKEIMLSEFETSTIGVMTTGLATNVRLDAGRSHLDNFKNLKTYLEAKQLSSTLVRTFDNNFVNVTLAELDSIIIDEIGYGLWLYQRKWQLEVQIDTATEETLDSITFFQ